MRIVKSIRGSKGGFKLNKPLEEIRLIDVFQAIEGPFKPNNCLMETPVCNGKRCILGVVVENVNNHVFDYFSQTKISQLSNVFEISNFPHNEEVL